MADIPTFTDLEVMIQRVIGYVLALAGIVLFVLLIMGGFQYITSGGDPKAAEGAKKTITSALLGLVIILVSYLILVLLSNITKVDLTHFNIIAP